MGPGNDLDILKNYYDVVGSDKSKLFVDIYNENHKDIECIVLDAVEIEIDRKFDCIYSNKVLHHLEYNDFVKSIKRQFEILNDNGIIFMTLWKGNLKREVYDNLIFMYYMENDILEIIGDKYEVLELSTYTEIDEDDSLIVILKKK